MPKIPFFLVTGFLGSGKTTFVKRFIDRFGASQRIGVIQNEFAPGSVDGTELKNRGGTFEILEVNNGSVFCVCLLSSFVKSLADFIEAHQPEMVLMEASGLSDPISIGEMLQGSELKERIFLSHIWSIVDASKFEKLAKGLPRIQHQVRVADTVVINKVDKEGVDPGEISAWARRLNPFATIESSSFCETEIKPGQSGFMMAPVALRQQEEFASLKASGAPDDVGTYVIKTTRTLSLSRLEAFMEEVAPGSIRIKGFVRLDSGGMMAVQSCFGETGMEMLSDYTGPTELIGIGPHINSISFGKRFQELTRV